MLRKAIIIFLLVTGFIFGSTGVAAACTIFTVSDNGTVYFGNNEDFTNPNTYYWVEPSRDGRYGGVYFGFDNFWPQGGINEKGLAFDINSLPETPLNAHPELPSFDTYEGYSILRNCATVEEAIRHVKQYNWGAVMGGQVHVADAGGDAVVIGPGPDGELAFTRKAGGDGYLVSTNFNPAMPDGEDKECERYQTALTLLEDRGDDEGLALDYVKNIMDAAHTEGAGVNTLYSIAYDLRNRTVFIYYFHQFDEVVELSVDEELEKETAPVLLSSLFSEATVERAASEKSGYVFRDILVDVLKILGAVIVLVLAFFLFRYRRRRRRKVSV